MPPGSPARCEPRSAVLRRRRIATATAGIIVGAVAQTGVGLALANIVEILSFGNIMLMSFPEYLSFRFQDEAFYIQVFSWLNLALSLPIFFYSASEYFVSAWKGLRHKVINLDVPISHLALLRWPRRPAGGSEDL